MNIAVDDDDAMRPKDLVKRTALICLALSGLFFIAALTGLIFSLSI